MARPRKAKSQKVTRLEARTRAISVVNLSLFLALCLAVGFVVVAASVPQYRKLAKLEGQLLEAREREAAVLVRRDDGVALHRALKEDPACLEEYARDRLDYHRSGERVLRFKRSE